MLYSLILAIAGLAISIFICRLIMPFIINASLKSGLTTVDAHKRGKPIIAEPGGLAPLLSFIFSFLILILVLFVLNSFIPNCQNIEDFYDPNCLDIGELPVYLGGILAVVIAGLIGFIDDVFGPNLQWRHKIILGFIPSLPLVILRAFSTSIETPFGVIDFGILYPLVIIPLGMNFAFNSYNMLAGNNGLETGLGIISFSSILVVAFWVSNPFVIIFAAAMLGGLIVLFKYNKYPAKILIGNAGTLMLGASLFVALVLGNMERLAIGIFLLYLMNFLMFFMYLRDKKSIGPNGKRKKLADIDEEENLVPPSPWTIYWVLPYFKKNTKEYTNVAFILILHIIICLITILWFFSEVPIVVTLP